MTDLITYVIGQLRGACWEEEAAAVEALVQERDAYVEQLMTNTNTFSEMHIEIEQLRNKISEMQARINRLTLGGDRR